MRNKGIFVTLLLCFIGQLCYAQDAGLTGYTFEQFEKQFGRTYQGAEREAHRKAFYKNYQELLSIRSKSGSDYNVQVNNFTDMTDQELNNFLNYRPADLNMPYDQLPKFNKLRAVALPQSLNYTAQGKVTSVKTQGKCGACWAFTTTGMYESQLLLKGIGEYDLAEQYVLQCTFGASCNGGWPNSALNMFTEKGIPLESAFPYKGQAGGLENDQVCSSDQLIKLPYQIQSIKHYATVPDTQLKQILLDHGPVSVGVKGSRNGFLFYSGGVFSGCDQNTEANQVDHVVLLVGWTKEGDWIIRNSWGKSWGDRGYGVISRTRNCGITHFVDVLEVGSVRLDDKNAGTETGNEMENIKVSMSDSFGDGWNGYVMGVRQQNSIITVFGEEFKSGSEQGPIDIEIKSGVETEIVVAVVGKNSHEIGFKILNSEGKEICSRKPGSQFQDSIIFCSFCPSCESSNKVTYELTLTDASKNGWNGNVLAFKQDGVSNSFGQQFISGEKYGPRKIDFIKNLQVEVWPYLIGERPEDIGFELRDSFGNIVAQRLPGTSFTPDTKLGQFCPGCENIFTINYNNNGDMVRDAYMVTRESDQLSIKPFIIAVSVLATLVVLLVGALFVMLWKAKKAGLIFNKKKISFKTLVSMETQPNDSQGSRSENNQYQSQGNIAQSMSQISHLPIDRNLSDSPLVKRENIAPSMSSIPPSSQTIFTMN